MNIERITNHLLRFPLDSPVGGSGILSVDVLVTELRLASGTTGLGFSYVLGNTGKPAFCCAEVLAAGIVNTHFYHPAATWRTMNATLNRTGRGPNNIAMAAIDVACWDAYAREHGHILGVALGGEPRAISVYGSGGYSASQTADKVTMVTKQHVDAGFKAVKPRIDASRSGAEILRAACDAASSNVDLMCDMNEKGTATQARRLMAIARECGYLFVEEPIPTDNLSAYRALARAYPRFAAVGEHLQGVKDAMPFLAEDICGVIQPDLAMIGGLTPALEVSRVADAHDVEVAPHFLPGLFVHLGYACPSLTWLEDFPLLEPLFKGWPAVVNGRMIAREVPGHGLSLVDGAFDRFRLAHSSIRPTAGPGGSDCEKG